jgi:hypothetical protein
MLIYLAYLRNEEKNSFKTIHLDSFWTHMCPIVKFYIKILIKDILDLFFFIH